MKIIKFFKKFITTIMLLLLLTFILVYFNNKHSNLDFNAFALIGNSNKDALNIPSDINFIKDDKNAFIKYFKAQYDINQDINIDDDTYIYFGNVNGYRFYRINVDYMPAENLNHEDIINGFTFQSNYLFRPYSPGLYVIGDSGVYTLEEACNKNLVDISQIYMLYLKKN